MPDASDTLQVYGNVDEVELLLNGKSLARRRPDNGPSTSEYVSRPDGGNAEHINYPPFTFFGVKWESGELKAVGYKDGRKVAEQTVCTPGRAEAIDISYFESGVPASRNDLLIVYVSLKDARGTGCFGENGQQVKLEVTAGGELRSPQQVNTEAGVASFLVATGNASTLTLKATCGQLTATRKLKLK